MIRCGIFGPSLSGKTTLARHLSEQYWHAQGLPSLVLDPHLEKWGPQAWATADEEQFWAAVWSKRKCLVIAEEAAETICRDRELTPVFTRLRHQEHKLLIIGHDGTDLLPVMRRQFDVLYLFTQPEDAVKIWKRDLPNMRGLEQASNLGQYEFLRCKAYQTASRMRLKL